MPVFLTSAAASRTGPPKSVPPPFNTDVRPCIAELYLLSSSTFDEQRDERRRAKKHQTRQGVTTELRTRFLLFRHLLLTLADFDASFLPPSPPLIDVQSTEAPVAAALAAAAAAARTKTRNAIETPKRRESGESKASSTNPPLLTRRC